MLEWLQTTSHWHWSSFLIWRAIQTTPWHSCLVDTTVGWWFYKALYMAVLKGLMRIVPTHVLFLMFLRRWNQQIFFAQGLQRTQGQLASATNHSPWLIVGVCVCLCVFCCFKLQVIMYRIRPSFDQSTYLQYIFIPFHPHIAWFHHKQHKGFPSEFEDGCSLHSAEHPGLYDSLAHMQWFVCNDSQWFVSHTHAWGFKVR